ncbi:hypothetical protein [Myceligenerans pegani]|uniref:Phosphotransferase n=1 Tax=Myceligenerans pegani TaxID=2776917 RepID=A0ABR9N0Z0_9MICO|nr:hypothetical protein [Myceligenerans sp. TRM 65318]MBE1877321.1 hypothetical protein [Myceligenerans sp. TRM 65318]MBE3019592.1 hypothetical protein [Myceligenerans sp. TRM 65318]
MASPASLRPGWPDIPSAVRTRVSEAIGARVLGWTSLPGGRSAGGYELQLQAGGVNYYVRAADSHNPVGHRRLRAELGFVRALPAGAPVPPLVWTVDEEVGGYGKWLALGFAMPPVRLPELPWADAEVDEALELAYGIGDIAVPGPHAGGSFPAWQDLFDTDAWTRLAKDHPAALASFGAWLPGRVEALAELAREAAAGLSGDRLGHHVLRREAVFLAAERGAIPPLAVDWAVCGAGPAFTTTLSMLGLMHAQGGPAPEQALAIRPFPGSYDADEVTAYLAVLAGHHAYGSLLPPDPASPLTRAAQREHARALTDWLRRRLRR